MNCPSCGAAMVLVANRGHFRCDHCGRFHFPETTGEGVSLLDEPADIDCPRCQLAMRQALIEGETVSYCGQCRGFLTQTEAFSVIVGKRRAKQVAPQRVTNPIDPAELRQGMKCPRCRNRMETHPYYGGGNAVVDSCVRCKLIWLDAGELALIGSYVPHVRKIEPPLDLYREETRGGLGSFTGFDDGFMW
jgi:Zn-finger nucleic acid-binding protein